jgi:hypothetical protein
VDAPLGMLMGEIEGVPGLIHLGSNGRLTAARTGKLYLLLNGTMADKADSAGGVSVLVEQE